MRLKGVSAGPGRTAWINCCRILIRLCGEETGGSAVLAVT